MFACIARITLDIPDSGSLKAKRQVVRRVSDRVKAKFNVAVAEVDENEAFNRAVIALSVVGNSRRFAADQMEKILHAIEEMYIAPIAHKQSETVAFDDLLGALGTDGLEDLTIPTQERSLAEAEGLGAWEDRHKTGEKPAHTKTAPKGISSAAQKKLSLEEARAKARSLRNPREWEK